MNYNHQRKLSFALLYVVAFIHFFYEIAMGFWIVVCLLVVAAFFGYMAYTAYYSEFEKANPDLYLPDLSLNDINEFWAIIILVGMFLSIIIDPISLLQSYGMREHTDDDHILLILLIGFHITYALFTYDQQYYFFAKDFIIVPGGDFDTIPWQQVNDFKVDEKKNVITLNLQSSKPIYVGFGMYGSNESKKRMVVDFFNERLNRKQSN